MFRKHRTDLIAAAILLVLVVLFLWQYVLTDKILPRGDAFTYFYPYWDYKHSVLREGRLPLWNPYLFMGAPLLANSQAGVLYPPNWPLTFLSTPVAVKVALVTHICWGVLGMYVFARRIVHLDAMPAVVAAVVFGLSGYVGAQVEHVNQVQGMVWLPWLFLVWSEVVENRRYRLASLLAAVIALMLLAGHTQSAFICGVGLGVHSVWTTLHRWIKGQRSSIDLAMPLAALAVASAFSLALAAAQLLPTLELTALSNRSGGLTALEAVSFSLDPLLLGRTLLTDFTAGEPLFPEYVAYLGVSVLIMAVLGAYENSPRAVGMLIVVLAGLFLALGAYNPVYWFLVNLVPGFGLFRAPARWMLLAVFGAAALTGIGLQRTIDSDSIPRRHLMTALGLITGLAGLAYFSPIEAQPGIGVGEILVLDVILWLGVATLVGLFLMLRQLRPYRVTFFAALVAVELFLASHAQPYNRLSSPHVWTNSRQAIDVLRVAQAEEDIGSRMLSISETFFDPGDLREINAAYESRLAPQELEDYIIGTKQKEILSPNLPLGWRISSIDGFDGGVLPTRNYIAYTAQFLPEDVIATDGRLREYLAATPPLEYMSQTNTRYLITDKVFDAWVDGVYHDLQFPQSETAFARPWEPFEATGINLIAVDNRGADSALDVAMIEIRLGERDIVSLTVEPSAAFDPSLTEYRVETISWSEPTLVSNASIALESGVTLRGLTFVDERTDAFMPAVLTASEDWQVDLIHAADVKVYDVVSAAPRAQVICATDIVFVESLEETWQHLPDHTVILGDAPEVINCDDDVATIDVTAYEAESIEVEVAGIADGHYLIIADAFFPGWEVNVNGDAVELLVANGVFRAVPLSQGATTLTMVYKSQPFRRGLIVSAIAWSLIFVAQIVPVSIQKR